MRDENVVPRREVTRMTRSRRSIGITLGILLALAVAPATVAREAVDPSTLNPAPADWWTVSCERQGVGILCELSFTEDPIIDEPSGVVCDDVELLISVTRSVIGKRFYDADGNLLQRHYREFLDGTYSNPETGLVATWIQHDTVVHDLGSPGVDGTGTERLSGLFTRVTGPDGLTILLEVGRIAFDNDAGELTQITGQHPFYEYFDLGDSDALAPLCDALD
jgi:hypothetical protein